MRKTDNDALLERPKQRSTLVQTALPLGVELKPPELSPLEQQRRANIDQFLENCRREAQAILLVAQLQNPDQNWSRLQEVPTPQLAQAREAYEQRPIEMEPVPFPEAWPIWSPEHLEWQQEVEARSGQPKKPKAAPKPYKPWPLERRQRLAASKLRTRAMKRSSFPTMWQPWMQEQLLFNPWRFGVCPLPNEHSCTIPNPTSILARQKVLEKEGLLRSQEGAEPLKMPLVLKAPELVEVGRSGTEQLKTLKH